MSSAVDARLGVDAADSDSRLELRRTSRIPTRAFRVGVASYSSHSTLPAPPIGVASGVEAREGANEERADNIGVDASEAG